jgi:hypothetical protein
MGGHVVQTQGLASVGQGVWLCSGGQRCLHWTGHEILGLKYAQEGVGLCEVEGQNDIVDQEC